MGTLTTSYSFNLPTVGGDSSTWGTLLNANWNAMDDLLDGTSPIDGIDIDGGSIDGTPIGATAASTGAFSTFSTTGVATFGGGIDVITASSGISPRADAGADELVVENNGPAGITLLTPSTAVSSINFADAGSLTAGQVTYDHTDDTFRFYVNGNLRAVLDSDGLGIGATNPAVNIHLGGAAPELRFDSSGATGSTRHSQASSIYQVRVDPENADASSEYQITIDNTVYLRLAAGGLLGLGATTPAYSLDMQDKTDGMRIPAGTDAQRPTNAAGVMRYNTDSSAVEVGNGTEWSALGGDLGATEDYTIGNGPISANGVGVQNTSGKLEFWYIRGRGGDTRTVDISPDDVTYTSLGHAADSGAEGGSITVILLPGWYIRIESGFTLLTARRVTVA